MIEVFPSAEALAIAVAEHIAARAAGAIAAAGRFTLALAGGSTPREAYARLATDERELRTLLGSESTAGPAPGFDRLEGKAPLQHRVPPRQPVSESNEVRV